MRIDFLSFFIKRDLKRFSDWFEMTRDALETDFEMLRNSVTEIYFCLRDPLNPCL